MFCFVFCVLIFHPQSLGLKGLFHQAHLLCDIKEDLLCELEVLRNVCCLSAMTVQENCDKIINELWKVELNKQL